MTLYVDTSALVKWYVAESDSDAFDDFIRDQPGARISRLTVVELRCALARRRRNREISAMLERAAFKLFESHVRDGLLEVLTMQDADVVGALQILEALRRVPLRTLDALHLSVARANKVKAIATADRVMTSAAKALNFETHVFH
ncbi:MAG: type II toxin-antitoxin system VapC family toxin [Betaproteobacteria bacterium]